MLSNTASHYGTITKLFHWTIALGIFLVIPLGIYGNNLAHAIEANGADAQTVARAAFVFSLHKTIGLTILFTALARIAWAISQPKPEALNGDKKAEHWLASMIHWLLYGSLVLVPVTGWIHHAATSGFAPIWWPFGQDLPFVPKSDSTAHLFEGLHVVFERVLVASLVLHIAGALKHHVIDKDATLRRMWFGTTAVGPRPQQHSAKTAILGALAVWVIALGIGQSLGLYRSNAGQTTAALKSVASDWTVQSGEIGIAVTQFGSETNGSFSDWTSAITFDETAKTGSVTTTINIASLSIGSVTSQALGAEYFDAATHPTAIYEGQISHIEADQYASTGTLTLKGQSIPVEFTFDLTIVDGLATMSGTTRLDRTDFGIGAADEGTLGFGVDVSLNLTAAR